MKRILSFLLVAALMLSLAGCQQETVKLQKPVNFYYRNAQLSYGSGDSLISAQPSESAGIDDTLDLLNKYLKGPNSPIHEPTFPAGTKILNMSIAGEIAFLGMNEKLASLSSIDLTVACACITMTTIELTGVKKVCISASNKSLDGNPSITMSMEDMMLLDQYVPQETTQ